MNASGLQDNEVDQRHRRRGRRIGFAAVIACLIAVVSAGAWATRARPSGHRIIYTKTLPGGRVFQCFSDGAFIGSPGSEVEAGRAPQAPEGSEGGPALVVRPPDYTDEEARRAAEEYQKSGRSAEQDQAEFDRLSAECRRRR
jgi:hypothetical protein